MHGKVLGKVQGVTAVSKHVLLFSRLRLVPWRLVFFRLGCHEAKVEGSEAVAVTGVYDACQQKPRLASSGSQNVQHWETSRFKSVTDLMIMMVRAARSRSQIEGAVTQAPKGGGG
jgi:hypothetical protein